MATRALPVLTMCRVVGGHTRKRRTTPVASTAATMGSSTRTSIQKCARVASARSHAALSPLNGAPWYGGVSGLPDEEKLMNRALSRAVMTALAAFGLQAVTAEAVVVPKKEASLAGKSFRQPELFVPELQST